MAFTESGQSLAVQSHKNRKSNLVSPETVMETIMPHVSTTDVIDMGVSNPIIDGSETGTPTMHVHTNYGELKSHTAQIDMGISHPISASFATAAPTKHVHTTDGEAIPHTAPIEGNLVSVPIIYVEEKEPSPRDISEKPKQ